MSEWTVCQHSGFGYGGNPQFRRGLELVALTSNNERRTVEMAGGLLFSDYKEAELWAHRQEFPAGYTGMIPMAPGQFSPMKIRGLPIYVPVPVPA